MTVTITRAETPADLDAVRGLTREFHQWAMADVSPGETPATFANMDAELAALPGIFGAPSGCLLLARLNGDPVGCLAFFARNAMTMEVKRMYVRPAARGHRIGERLVTDILAEAQRGLSALCSVQPPFDAPRPCDLSPSRISECAAFRRFPRCAGWHRNLHGNNSDRRTH